MLAPVIGFGLLFISEVVTFVFISILGPGTRYEHFRHPVMAVHATAVLFYLILYVPGSLALEDRFGRPLYPLRYFFWFVSVSSLGQSVFMLVEALPGHQTREKELDNMLARYLVAVPVCFGTGFLSSWIMAPVPALFWLSLSFGGFWYMLHHILMMLGVAETHPMVVKDGNALQFRVIRYTLIIVWHGFPIIWMLAAADYISVITEHAFYVANDLVAKYLILFVCLAVTAC